MTRVELETILQILRVIRLRYDFLCDLTEQIWMTFEQSAQYALQRHEKNNSNAKLSTNIRARVEDAASPSSVAESPL